MTGIFVLLQRNFSLHLMPFQCSVVDLWNIFLPENWIVSSILNKQFVGWKSRLGVVKMLAALPVNGLPCRKPPCQDFYKSDILIKQKHKQKFIEFPVDHQTLGREWSLWYFIFFIFTHSVDILICLGVSLHPSQVLCN